MCEWRVCVYLFCYECWKVVSMVMTCEIRWSHCYFNKRIENLIKVLLLISDGVRYRLCYSTVFKTNTQ